MWEDDNAWNSYADSYSPSNDYSNYNGGDWSGDWGGWDDGSSYSGYAPGSGGSLNYGYEDSGWQPSVPQEANRSSWQQNYDYTPTYVSGAVNNPHPAQYESAYKTGPDLGEKFLQDAGGDPQRAHSIAMYYRSQPGYENNPVFRDAEHYLSTEKSLSNPYVNLTGVPQMAAVTLPPAYSAAKWLAQMLPPELGKYIPYLYNASPPSLSEVWSGMAPVFKGR